jgi:hypothetical protein
MINKMTEFAVRALLNPDEKYLELKSFKDLLGFDDEALMRHENRVDKCLSCLERFLFQAYYRPVVLATVT